MALFQEMTSVLPLTMTVIKISTARREEATARASEIIRKGGIAAFPTETFYGLGVRFDNEKALERLYELKHRPKEKAMPVIIGSREELKIITSSLPPSAERLIERFWPGPLTILLNASDGLSEFITSGTGKAAVRIPGDSFALDLVRSIGFPITATSANISGMPPADNPQDVMKYFPAGLDILIDGGKTPGGEASTIVDVTMEKPMIVRYGKIPEEKIMAALKH